MKIENIVPFASTNEVIQGDLRSMSGNAFYSVIVTFFCRQHRFTTDHPLIILIGQYELTIKHVDIVIYRYEIIIFPFLSDQEGIPLFSFLKQWRRNLDYHRILPGSVMLY